MHRPAHLITSRIAATSLALALAAGCKGPAAEAPAARPATKPKAPATPAPSAAKVGEAAHALAEAEAARTAETAKADKRRRIEAAAEAKLAREGAPSPSEGLPNIAPGTIERAVLNSRVAPGEDRDLAAKWMVKRIRNVAANHDAPALKRWCTPRLQAEIDTMLPKHGARFWKHLDRYASAGSNGYEVKEERVERPGRVHLTVHAKPDIVLKPVLERTPQGWRFDRF